jgi:DNA-binding transcriptional LysR family regulator
MNRLTSSEGQGVPADPSAHQLRLFLLLAEELHFGRAAMRAFMTQPAFSQQIRALERRLGLTLVARTTRTTGLTTAGKMVLPKIHSIVNALDQLRHAASDQIRTLSGLRHRLARGHHKCASSTSHPAGTEAPPSRH